MNKLLLTTLTLSPLLTGCATMFSGGTSEVTFLSKPPGAHVRVGEVEGTTPAKLTISKKATLAEVSFENGTTQEVELERTMNGGYILMDILFTPGFGLSGLLIDGMSSSWYEHPAVVQLERDQSGVIQASAPVDAAADATAP